MKKFFTCFLFLQAFTLCAKGRTDNLNENYFEIANAYAEVKNYEKALYFYEKAGKDALYKNACDYNSARMYGLLNRWAEAKKILHTLYESEPDNEMILQAYAYSLIMTGKNSEGKELYRQLAEKNIEDPESLLTYIRILVFIKDYQTAQETVDKAILDFPSAKERPDFDKLKTQIERALNKPEEKGIAPVKENTD